MAGGLKITLRAGERIFINGGVLRVDRKVSLELMNDVIFLLEQHVMKPEETTTPLRQLYFMIQMMLMDPSLHMKARAMAKESVDNLLETFSDATLMSGLIETGELLDNDRPFDALRKVRALLPQEVAGKEPEQQRAKEVA
jgi:flagellar biosynthesis repressor protein FlbT